MNSWFVLLLLVAAFGIRAQGQNGDPPEVCLELTLDYSLLCTEFFDKNAPKIEFISAGVESERFQECAREIVTDVSFSCTFTSCFTEASEKTISISISEQDFLFDLTATPADERVDTLGDCPAGSCDTCPKVNNPLEQLEFYRVVQGTSITFDLSPFINFEPTPSPTTRTNEETTPAPTPIAVDEQTPSPEVNAEGNDSNVIVFIAGVVLGLMAFSIIAIMTLRKSHYFQKKSKREDSEVKVLPSPYLNTLSPKSPNNQLHQVLMQRFSLNSSVGWRTMSIATDISAFSLKTYKTNITEEERRKTQQLRATSVNLSANMSRVHELFRSKAGSTRSDLIRTTREVVNAVHAQIESELEEDSEDNDGNVRLKGFNGEALPFGLEDYIFRLITGLNSWFSADSKGTGEAAGVRCLLFAVIYLRKIQSLERGFKVTAFNIHRLITVLMLVAAKMTEDELISNQFWADVSGMKMGELNVLEQELCFQTGLDFNVDPATLRETCREFGVDARMGVSFNGDAPISIQVSP